MTKLELYRKRAKLSQKALAGAADLTQACISNIERGKREDVPLSTARQLVAALQLNGIACSLDEVFPNKISVRPDKPLLASS